MTCREVLQRAEIKCSTTEDPGDLEGAWSGRTIKERRRGAPAHVPGPNETNVTRALSQSTKSVPQMHRAGPSAAPGTSRPKLRHGVENNIFEAHSRERRGLRVRIFPPAGSVGGTRGATNRLGGSRDCVRAAPRPLAPGPPAEAVSHGRVYLLKFPFS